MYQKIMFTLDQIISIPFFWGMKNIFVSINYFLFNVIIMQIGDDSWQKFNFCYVDTFHRKVSQYPFSFENKQNTNKQRLFNRKNLIWKPLPIYFYFISESRHSLFFYKKRHLVSRISADLQYPPTSTPKLFESSSKVSPKYCNIGNTLSYSKT